MKRNRLNEKLEAITAETLVVGVDIAKRKQWARFVNFRGAEMSKAVGFENTANGFDSIITQIEELFNTHSFEDIIVGMEPTGHYWKPLANYLTERGITVVCVNPYHTKKAKELDDNSQTKSDKKDALTIAKLVKDGRYYHPKMLDGVYAELRILGSTRQGLIKNSNKLHNQITAVIDEYFPELGTVWANIIDGKTVRHILKTCPFPQDILELGEDGVLAEIRKAVKKSVGIKKVRQLLEAAQNSVGVEYGTMAAKFRLCVWLEELELIEKHIEQTEELMNKMLKKTGYSEEILSIDGVGEVTTALLLGEIGDLMEFENSRQITNYAGLNLVENSSGKNKSGTSISKRGRASLRALLYQMAFTAVGKNAEMKALYTYLLRREKNPLKKKQALIVVAKKLMDIIFALVKNHQKYRPEAVFNSARLQQLALAA